MVRLCAQLTKSRGAASYATRGERRSAPMSYIWEPFVRTTVTSSSPHATLSSKFMHPTWGGVRYGQEGEPECFPSTNVTPLTA